MIYDSRANIERYHSIFEVGKIHYHVMNPTSFSGVFEAHSKEGVVLFVEAGSILVSSTYSEGAPNLLRDINGFVHLQTMAITTTVRLDSEHFLFFSPYELYSIVVDEKTAVARVFAQVH